MFAFSLYSKNTKRRRGAAAKKQVATKLKVKGGAPGEDDYIRAGNRENGKLAIGAFYRMAKGDLKYKHALLEWHK